PCVNSLNPSSFQLPAVGTYGSAVKGMLRGPNLINWDMGVFKGIPITERWENHGSRQSTDRPVGAKAHFLAWLVKFDYKEVEARDRQGGAVLLPGRVRVEI